jgi:parallel beta-helix repeat protein
MALADQAGDVTFLESTFHAQYLLGTEAPDNPAYIGDTVNHHVYYYSTGWVQDDICAVRASQMYQAALGYMQSGDFEKAAFNIGAMTHYVADVGAFGHTMAVGTDWGAEIHHADYESAIEAIIGSISPPSSVPLGDSDAYAATLALAERITFGDGTVMPNVWMDANYDWSDATFAASADASLYAAVEATAAVIDHLLIESLEAGYIHHSAIAIYGNDDFTAENGVVRGSGTAAEPFIIEGWEISSLLGSGIEIWNADVQFVIQDCYVHDCGGLAVYLNSCSNGMIWNCTCSGSLYDGIRLDSSDDNRLINNTCNSNDWSGIVLGSSSDNTLGNNSCSSNNQKGMYLGLSCDNNTIRDNTCSNNDMGIYLVFSCDNNTISYNTCTDNGNGMQLDFSNNNTICNNNFSSNNQGSGIYLPTSNNNTICNNTCNSNELIGIILGGSNNTICNNTCVSNPWDGIYLGGSNNNTICNNTCLNSNVGIELESSSDNTVSNNICNSNDWMGMWLWTSSDDNTVINNSCISNNGDGMQLISSSDNTVCDNTYGSNNGCGLVLQSSSDSTLGNNTCRSNNGFGIYLGLSNNITIGSNTCSNNVGGGGIRLYYSDNCRVVSNTFSSNDWDGVELDTSRNNIIGDNNCSNNVCVGVYSYSSSDNTVYNNTCTSNGWDGIRIEFSSDDNALTNNICDSNGWDGIFLWWSDHNNICNNTCSNNYYQGIYLGSSSDNTICNNTCGSNGEDGILLIRWSGGPPSDYNSICNNTCSNNVWEGIELISSSDSILGNNRCSHNGDEGIWLDSSNSNILENNSCISNVWDGIGLGSSSDNILSDNNCSSNGEYGIWLDIWYGLGNSPGSLSNNNEIVRSQLCGNSGYGVCIDSGSNNRIWNNTYCNNNGATDIYSRRHVQAFDSGTGNWWNSPDGYGNNWSDWRSPDVATHDGIVDYPYRIDGAAHSWDYYPHAAFSADPSALIDALIKEIQSWKLTIGAKTGLTSKLSDAMALLEKGNVNGALHKLMDFASMVHALAGKQLTSAQADYALTSAETIISLLR